MANTTRHSKFWFDEIMKKGYDYVCKNWHKFSHASKERIFLACMNKAIASKTENKSEVNEKVEVKITHVDLDERMELINKRFQCSN